MKSHEIDIHDILSETSKFFTSSKNFKKKLTELKNFIDRPQYEKIHYRPLVPTNIKINSFNFIKEIEQYENFFEQWGRKHSHIKRYGLALVNTDGELKKNDPINGSLYEYNLMNEQASILESDCKIKTEVMTIESLKPLKIFDGFWYRSNILKWIGPAEFFPHIDNLVPAPWLRLWGTTNPDITLNFYYPNGKLISLTGMEPGRIYLIDTCLVHDAKIISGDVYQFFLCISADAAELIEHIIEEVQ